MAFVPIIIKSFLSNLIEGKKRKMDASKCAEEKVKTKKI